MAFLPVRILLSHALYTGIQCLWGAGDVSDDATPLVQREVHAPVSLSQQDGRDSHRGSNLLQLIDRALWETMMEQRPLQPGEDLAAERNRRPTVAHLTFKVKEIEPGAMAVLKLEEGTSMREEEDGSFTAEVSLVQQGNESISPHVEFGLTSPLNENSTFAAHIDVKLLMIHVARFSIDCAMCGGDCSFKVFGKNMQWELPPCPLPIQWTMPISLAGMSAPAGVSVDMDVKTMRSTEETVVAWELLTRF